MRPDRIASFRHVGDTKIWALLLAAGLIVSLPTPQRALAQEPPPLLPEKTVAALANELSGEIAKRNLEYLARLHRQRGSRAFDQAAEFIKARLIEYGVADAHIEKIPMDGHTMYGSQKSRLAWDADSAELWEVKQKDTGWEQVERLCDFDAVPVCLAEDSESTDTTADLVDVGAGTSDKDYTDKDVRGKIVLTSQSPGAAEALAVEKYGAVGLISYQLNQPQAWQGEDDNLIRWGHLDSFPKTPTFAFMVSLRTARELRARLAAGETIHLHATVKAGRHPGFYEITRGTIPGADPTLELEEIAFSCHLDHERPGANDNASGCVTILEVARTLQKLIAAGAIPRPARTVRFIFPPEIEGTLALLNGRPDMAPHIRAVVHMDMVGGAPVTKSIFHVTRAPMSLPSFINDVAESFADFVNRESDEVASTGQAAYPLTAPEGGKEALLAQLAEYSAGSDHDVYEDSSYHIPAIYMNDWPDRYIHTNGDSAANIDPTKLLRAGFIGGASGYYLAGLGVKDEAAVLESVEIGAMRRMSTTLRRQDELMELGKADEAANLMRQDIGYNQEVLNSVGLFLRAKNPSAKAAELSRNLNALAGSLGQPPEAPNANAQVYARNPEPKGPVTIAFGYNYFIDKYGEDRASKIRIFQYDGLYGGPHGTGDLYAYEALNFADGKRTVQGIRDALSAEFGPIPLEIVVEYLHALESIGVLREVK